MQVLKLPNKKGNSASGSNPELRRTSSFDRSWEETVAESVANELVLQSFSNKSGHLGSAPEVTEETSKSRTKDSKPVKSGRLSHEEKKVGKAQDEKRTKSRKLMEFHNIKISQVSLLHYILCSLSSSCLYTWTVTFIIYANVIGRVAGYL